MFHFASPVPDWPRAVEKLPEGYAVKFIDNVQALAEAKAHNPGIVRILRHWFSPHQQPGADYEDSKRVARAFFATFIDRYNYYDGSTAGTPHRTTEYVEGWNEYAWSPGQPEAEQLRWAHWVRAILDVWYTEYWPDLGGNLIVCNIAVGNDCHRIAAEAVARWTDVEAGRIPRIGYHAYWPVSGNQVVGGDDEWRYYSGRWAAMDESFRRQGIYPLHWALTEAGPVGARGTWPHISLDPIGGWRDGYVHNGDWQGYERGLRRFMNLWRQWNAAHCWRCLSPNLYTSGGSKEWRDFELLQPQLDAAAAIAGDYPTKPPIFVPGPSSGGNRMVRVRSAANVRLSPAWTGSAGGYNKLGTLPAGAELELLGWQTGQTWQNNTRWAKVRLTAGYANGDLGLEGFIHSLLVSQL